MNPNNRNGAAWTFVLVLVMLVFSSPSLRAQGHVVSGTVLDENGLPLIGAGVLTQDGKRGVITDLDGKYTISILESDKVLSYSYLGYATSQVVVDGRKQIDVTLNPDTSNSLNEVVVIGYGTSKKADLTGSVASVKMGDIEDVPTTSVDQALQGKIAGVDIMSTTGEPGAGTSIRVRGTRSIEASNEPLIVVDGVMDAVSDLSEIASSDIKSISVLKDASSTAIYGSRGANGVILVTTKQGATAKPTVRVNARFGISTLARKLDLMDKDGFLQYRNDYAFIETYIKGNTPSAPSYDPADYTTDTDWLDEITRTAYYQSYSVSVSGKSGKNNYYGAMSYVFEPL